jgi:hypothetical protein
MDRLRKYKVGDLVECVAITPWNVEKLCLGAYYSVEGSTFLVNDMVYSLKSLDTGHMFYSIDMFERIGEVVKADEDECGKCIPTNEACKSPLGTPLQTPAQLSNEMGAIFQKGFEDGMAIPDTDFEKVNHPSHYNSYEGFEVIDVIEQVTEHLKGIESVCIGNVIKYVLRYQFKHGVEDLKKARFYLDKVIKKLERDNNKV